MQRAVESLEIETKAVADVLATLDKDAFAAAVDLLANADRIITSASGSSGVAAKKFAHTLCCVERPAQFLPPVKQCTVVWARYRKTTWLFWYPVAVKPQNCCPF